MLRTCTTCHATKPLDAFVKKASCPDGRAAQCKACRNAAILAWRTHNREHVRQQDKGYRAANREKRLQVYKRSYQKHKAERLAKAKAHSIQRWQDNNTVLRIAARLYYQANKPRILAQRQADRHANPEKHRNARALRRARKLAAPVVERVALSVVYARDKGICSLCHERVPRAEASIDHIIPLTKGGEHSYRNVALAHLRCNSSKHNNVVTQQMRLF